jgi:hypothetical protein
VRELSAQNAPCSRVAGGFGADGSEDFGFEGTPDPEQEEEEMDERRLRGRTDGQRLFDEAATARRFQRRLRGVAPEGGRSRGPILYDESGYPLEERTSLTDRVRRLITG